MMIAYNLSVYYSDHQLVIKTIVPLRAERLHNMYQQKRSDSLLIETPVTLPPDGSFFFPHETSEKDFSHWGWQRHGEFVNFVLLSTPHY